MASCGGSLAIAPGTPIASFLAVMFKELCSLTGAEVFGSIISCEISRRVKSISRFTCAEILPAPTIGDTKLVILFL